MIHIEALTKEYPTKTLFNGASAHLRPETRVGLVGRNGTGKTTLLRMIIGQDTADEGSIRQRPWLRIGYLPQELDTPTNLTVLQAAHKDQYPEHEAKRILSGLGFGEGDWHRTLATYSGGYRMRVALGHLLLSHPDVLMLDEPTNHLDKPTQAWFESFLMNSNMTMLIISHDTAFLDRVVTHIWEIRDAQLQEFRGNYSTFQKLRLQLDTQQSAAAQRQAKEVARVQKFVDRFRYKANKAKQVQSRIKQLEKVKLIEGKRDTKRLRFRFPEPKPSGKLVLTLDGIRKQYGEKVVYKNLDFSVERGQRVALVGENGAGKTTLLKILSGVLPFEAGKRTEGHGVSIHYFAQHQAEILNPEHSILESLAEAAPQAEMNYLRGIAGVFLFSGDDQKKPIKALSGGERNRVALARMLVEPANTLLLDEPTNHLDPISVDVLTDAMTDFPGTIVFISHDPVFLSRVSTRVVEIEEGVPTDYIGDYEYYLWKQSKELEELQKQEEAKSEAQPKKKNRKEKTNGAAPVESPSREKSPNRRDLTKSINRLERQVAQAEEEIAGLEEQINERATELAAPDLYKDFARWNDLHQEHERWKHNLEIMTNKWSDLSSQLEIKKQQMEQVG
ncbi:ABC-F family ATP-binding cassette domain-containing protein [Candidatus Nitronereus thalassa]|uniref:ABC-F family ATP-binding cassette domain-containing protein n=1 Tax=Candidatus Nitronereus thalassa TaxID=3020898 RepID=A0ABU3K791_9BACT|nr:ABC-F family ATP-binding cassette domain-containing protein [Candidatus Nitronereus thalassa]MDT7042223.1 ABC-F family ATP-binding cassette domain-containing protein [Candidatus Nitronereus thalassa]